MLDQVVVGVLRESQRIEAQRVDHRFVKQPEPRCLRAEMGQVKGNQVMA